MTYARAMHAARCYAIRHRIAVVVYWRDGEHLYDPLDSAPANGRIVGIYSHDWAALPQGNADT